jgi:endonuclease/exonuclease/phosphatase family metal-dependent hydrolase
MRQGRREEAVSWRVGADVNELVKWFIGSEGTLDPSSVPKKRKGALRLCTYNVHFWLGPEQLVCELNVEEMMAVVAAVDADVIVFNEFVPVKDTRTMDGLVERLERSLGYVHHTVKGSPSYRDVTFVTVIFSRLPLEERQQIGLCEDRHAVRVRVEGGLQVVGMHLDVFDETGKTRNKQVEQVLAKTRGLTDVVLVGDMNALRRNDYSDEEWEKLAAHDRLRKVALETGAVDAIERTGFRDSFEGLGPTPSCTTWSGRRIDYVFLKTPNWRVLQSFVVHSAASDHIPVVVDLAPK